MKLRALHRASAVVVALYSGFHILNHLLSLVSIELHISVMDSARTLYRQPIIEALLLFCVVFQIGSGVWMAIRGWKLRSGWLAWLQALSGLYLAFFLVIHVGAVILGRTSLDLDTNFYFAAAGFHVPPNQYFFGPYYFFAVIALFTHIACALYWSFPRETIGRRQVILLLPILLGGAISLAIVMSLAGWVQPFEVPPQYKATYGAT